VVTNHLNSPIRLLSYMRNNPVLSIICVRVRDSEDLSRVSALVVHTGGRTRLSKDEKNCFSRASELRGHRSKCRACMYASIVISSEQTGQIRSDWTKRIIIR
jgi:hypothetical protein